MLESTCSPSKITVTSWISSYQNTGLKQRTRMYELYTSVAETLFYIRDVNNMSTQRPIFYIRAQVDSKNRNRKLRHKKLSILASLSHPCQQRGIFIEFLILNRLCTHPLLSFAQRCPCPPHPATVLCFTFHNVTTLLEMAPVKCFSRV